ncbi:hypothetical protein M3Y99_00402200 [Aphelenchoides fujianensis]|nr:hypothetical protein M3Y99_00402200 [Aphelenchoides fujianensis]
MAAVAGAIERQQKLQAGGHDPSAAQLGNQLAAGQGAPFSVADVTNLSASDAFLRQQLLASSAGAGMNQEAAKPAGQRRKSAVGANRPGTGPGARFSSQTPAPAASSASQSSSVAMHAAAALHPALGAIGLPQQEQLRQQQLQQAAKLHPMARALLPNNLPANSMTPDGANMMNFLYQQHQQAQRQQKTQQEQEAETMRQLQLMEKEMQKKTEMAMRQKEEESQRARQQAQQRSQLSAAQQQRPGPSNQQQQQQQQAQLAQQQQLQLQQQQQFLAALAGMPMQAAASGAGGQPLVPPNYLQNLPAATQFMLQQMMPGQQQPGASTAAQTAGLPANFLEALVAQSAAGQGQQAAQLDAQAREATASVQAAQNPFGQLNANAMNNPEAFRQLQQNMLERSMNPALYAQLLQAQQQHQQQQQQSQLQMQLVQQLQQQHQMQQRGIAPINPNQLASLVGGMPSMMEAELLMRQMSGQQLPSNLQRTAQDRDQIVEQHRLFQQQLMAAANTANDPTAAGTSVLPPGMYNASPAQLAAQLRNGAAGPMGNLGQKK